jgi:hypothetical protein
MTIQDEPRSKWPVALMLVLICVAGISFGYVFRQRQQTKELAAANQTLNASLTQVQSDLRAVTEKLNDVLAAKTQPQPAAPAESVPAPRPKAKARPAQIRGSIVRRTPDDPRWSKMQGQLTDQQKQIESTREDLTRTRDDLGKTRDDLSTSIARSHDELVLLEKRGERNFTEFQLDKSKQYSRIGSVRLSLRKADMKHKSFDLAMLVDDSELQKKKVNLYEPVWINLAGEQLELVVNQITKDHVQGYLSAPKYKKSELAGIQ